MPTMKRARRRLALAVTTVTALVAAAPAAAQDPVILSTGHVDAINVVADGGGIGLTLKDDTGQTPVVRDPGDVILHAKPESEMAAPGEGPYGFLGPAGTPIWILPQTQNAELLWPGWSTEMLPQGTVEGNQVQMSLNDVRGPGEVMIYSVNAFAQPTQLANSSNGLPDTIPVNVPTHTHANWVFTAKGLYELDFEVTGALAEGGTEVTTGEVTYWFYVGDLADLELPGGEPVVPAMTVSGKPKVAKLARTGTLAVRCELATAGACDVEAQVARGVAKKLGLKPKGEGPVRIGSGGAELAEAGSARADVALSGKARRALKRWRKPLRLTLAATAAPLEGEGGTSKLRVTAAGKARR